MGLSGGSRCFNVGDGTPTPHAALCTWHADGLPGSSHAALPLRQHADDAAPAGGARLPRGGPASTCSLARPWEGSHAFPRHMSDHCQADPARRPLPQHQRVAAGTHRCTGLVEGMLAPNSFLSSLYSTRSPRQPQGGGQNTAWRPARLPALCRCRDALPAIAPH